MSPMRQPTDSGGSGATAELQPDERPDPTVPPISYCRVFQVGPACGRLCDECQAGINRLTPEQRRVLVSRSQRDPQMTEPGTAAPSSLTAEWAVEVVARQAIFNALDDIEWGNYPEIGEHDWQQVLDRIEVIGCGLKPMDDDYAEAYAVLESRAEREA